MKAIIIVPNLHCVGCVNLINSKLSDMKNINNLEVDMECHEIIFDYSCETDLLEAKNILRALGYPEFNDKSNIITVIRSLINCATNKFQKWMYKQ